MLNIRNEYVEWLWDESVPTDSSATTTCGSHCACEKLNENWKMMHHQYTTEPRQLWWYCWVRTHMKEKWGKKIHNDSIDWSHTWWSTPKVWQGDDSTFVRCVHSWNPNQCVASIERLSGPGQSGIAPAGFEEVKTRQAPLAQSVAWSVRPTWLEPWMQCISGRAKELRRKGLGCTCIYGIP